MKISLIILTGVSLLLSFSVISVHAAVDVGLSVGDEGLNSFYLAVGDYYRVPQSEVVVVRDHHVPYYDAPVVFFLAQRAHVAPATIVDLRLRGLSWMDITLHYGLSPEIYYVPVTYVPGPPYGKAYGYYKKLPRKKWKEIRLHDDDVVNLVNLGFISNHYRYKPEEVISLRSKGKEFVAVHDEVRKIEKRRDSKHEEDRSRGEAREHKGGTGHLAKEFHGDKGEKEYKEHKQVKENKGSKEGGEKNKGNGKKKD
ncbi:MAG: hypothetical protein ACM3ON_08210 [Chloroflexota bacterium]